MTASLPPAQEISADRRLAVQAIGLQKSYGSGAAMGPHLRSTGTLCYPGQQSLITSH